MKEAAEVSVRVQGASIFDSKPPFSMIGPQVVQSRTAGAEDEIAAALLDELASKVDGADEMSEKLEEVTKEEDEKLEDAALDRIDEELELIKLLVNGTMEVLLLLKALLEESEIVLLLTDGTTRGGRAIH